MSRSMIPQAITDTGDSTAERLSGSVASRVTVDAISETGGNSLSFGLAARRSADVPMICLATAHPAKFPDAVEAAIGQRPELPAHLADLFDRPERFDTLPADLATLQAHVRQVTGR